LLPLAIALAPSFRRASLQRQLQAMGATVTSTAEDFDARHPGICVIHGDFTNGYDRVPIPIK
jgi:hypothetical protein